MVKELPPNSITGNTAELSHKIESISDIEKEVFALIVPQFNDLRIDIEEFEGVYTKEEIQRDRHSVEKKRGNLDPSDPSLQRAQILEALLAEQIELSEWFGEDVLTIIPAEYDDLYHGVDITAEFQIDRTLKYLGLGIDITSSPGSVAKKIEKVKDHIRDGSLTEMKYFTSERLPDFHGRMANIPNTIIGTDVRTIRELCTLWLTIYKAKHPDRKLNREEVEELKEKAREAQQKLARHRIQVLLLIQIRDQLVIYREYAQAHTVLDKKDDILEKYDNLIKLVGDTLAKKQLSKTDSILNESDDVYRALKKEMNAF